MNFQKDFARRVVNARKKYHWTQESLAEEIGVSPTTIYRIEQGITKTDALVFIQVCKILKIDMNVFSHHKDYLG